MNSDALKVAQLLYGDGAWEIAKAMSAEEKKNRTQARVGLASNVVGIAAGAASIGAAAKNPALRRAGANLKNAGPFTSKVVPKMKNPKNQRRAIMAGAGGALGLQAANLGGDFVSNRVLARNAKDKPKKIHKGMSDVDKVPQGTGDNRLVRIGLKANWAKPKLPEYFGRNGKAVTREAGTHKAKEQPRSVQKSFDVTWTGEIAKVDTDKRQVFGWASIVEKDGKPVVDLQGDYLTVDEIEKAAYDYVLNSRKGGNQHQKDESGPRQVSKMIESFLVTDEKKEQMGLPDSVPTGWWVGFQVDDDETWGQVKNGEKKGFSIHGSGVRKELELP